MGLKSQKRNKNKQDNISLSLAIEGFLEFLDLVALYTIYYILYTTILLYYTIYCTCCHTMFLLTFVYEEICKELYPFQVKFFAAP